ncbi:MAG: hypothetical protein WAU04_05350, partial [Candidatus Nitrotoga sp.]
MHHADSLACIGGQECGVKGDVADVAACHLELRQLAVVQAMGRRGVREYAAPDGLALLGIG